MWRTHLGLAAARKLLLLLMHLRKTLHQLARAPGATRTLLRALLWLSVAVVQLAALNDQFLQPFDASFLCLSLGLELLDLPGNLSLLLLEARQLLRVNGRRRLGSSLLLFQL